MKAIFEEKSTFGAFGRSGVLRTRVGKVQTPAFMPDGTRGAVKGLTPQQVIDTGVEVVLANTYHLHLQPGEKAIKKMGGIHAFANRKGPILTDSGGFQVFSLGKHTKVSEEGVEFRDPKTGDKHLITPESSIQIQLDLGADMIVAFDHLVGLDEEVSEQEVFEAFERTHRWLERCIKEFKRLTKDMIGPEDPEYSLDDDSLVSDSDAAVDLSVSNAAIRTEPYVEASSRSRKSAAAPKSSSGVASIAGQQTERVRKQRRPLLFGVVQGGLDLELRKKSLEIVQNSEADGIAIGGLSVGETREEMETVLQELAPLYRNDKPRFLLGVGTPEDLKIAVENGIDMLDCVLPTRNARHGVVWGRKHCDCVRKLNQVELEHTSSAISARNQNESSRTVPNVQLAAARSVSDETSSKHSTSNSNLVCSRCGILLSTKVHLTNEKYKTDTSTIEAGCDCYTCASGFSKAFLRHQFKSNDPLAGTLASIHNLRHMMRLCEGYRDK